jgi:hypothetical protein
VYPWICSPHDCFSAGSRINTIEKAYSRATIVRLTEGILCRWIQGFPTTSIIMCDPSLKLLVTRDLRFGGIGLILSSIVFVIRKLTTTLMTAIPSSPIIFSKSTYAVASLFTCSTARLKYVPFELDLVISNTTGRL